MDQDSIDAGRNGTSEFRTVSLEALRPSKTNPRRHFDEESLKELVESVRSHGVLVPLLVRERSNGAVAFEIIAGERRRVRMVIHLVVPASPCS